MESVTVALLGNPNTGKSTLFQALTGVFQRVGNYPGCTVEKKIGPMALAGRRWRVIDLPGTYSLAPRSPDEMLSVDVLLGRQADVPPPDVILCIVDASNVQRNLFLVHQALELGRPLVVALNMTDIAERRGLRVDAGRLSAQLGVPVIPIQAHRRVGLEALKEALSRAAGTEVQLRRSDFPPAFQGEVTSLSATLGGLG
ncbi:MAG TPA: FeoB small GTPase domain-containing protein, partial [Pirellulaceae bacterium]